MTITETAMMWMVRLLVGVAVVVILAVAGFIWMWWRKWHPRT